MLGHCNGGDAIALIGQLLDRMVPPAGPKQAGPRLDRPEEGVVRV